MFDRDSGHKTFLEDAFENEARMIPGGNWRPASSPWANVVCSTDLKRLKKKKKKTKKKKTKQTKTMWSFYCLESEATES